MTTAMLHSGKGIALARVAEAAAARQRLCKVVDRAKLGLDTAVNHASRHPNNLWSRDEELAAVQPRLDVALAQAAPVSEASVSAASKLAAADSTTGWHSASAGRSAGAAPRYQTGEPT